MPDEAMIACATLPKPPAGGVPRPYCRRPKEKPKPVKKIAYEKISPLAPL
jgi:hypothetical protein